MSEIVVTVDNTKVVAKEIASAIEKALETIGIRQRDCVGYITKHHIVDTGRLRTSITHTHDGKDAYVGTNVEYAPYVHNGTYKMEGRPFLTEPVSSNVKKYRDIVKFCMENA